MRCSLLLSVLACCGCYSYTISSAAIGPSAPPRASTCPVDFSRERAQDLTAAYEQVGVICFASHDDTDERGFPIEGRRPDVDRVLAYEPGARHEAVQREACKLGGELVAPVGICGPSPGHLELGVWRKK